MSDPILDLYKQRAAAENEQAEQNAVRLREENDRKFQQLLEGIPGQLDRMFERLKVLNYSNATIKATIRLVEDPLGAKAEKVTWHVGRSEYRPVTHEDNVSDSFYVCSDRTFCKVVPVGMYVREGDPGVSLNLEDLQLPELQRVVEGIDNVGKPMPQR